MAIASSWFRSGTVSVTQNQVVVQGFNTAWVNHLTPIGEGDAFTTDFHTVYEVVEVLSDTQIRLDRPYAGSNGAKVPYAIIRNGSSNFSVRTAASVQKSLAWYQEQLATSEKLLTEDGDVIVSLPDGTDITLWTEKKKQRLWDSKMAEAQKELDDFKAESAEAVNRERFERCALSKAMAEAKAAINRNLFKGSGFVNMGKHKNGNVNQGLHCYNTGSNYWRNSFCLGINSGGEGDSLTWYPVVHIDGRLIDLQLNTNSFQFKNAPAPDGTQTYNSDTGVFIDYKTYRDPKFGNVAPNHNEAVLRAHNEFSGREPSSIGGNPQGQTTYDTNTKIMTFVAGANGAAWSNIGESSYIKTGLNDYEFILEAPDSDIYIEFRDVAGTSGGSPLMHSVTLKAGEKTKVKFQYENTTTGFYLRAPAPKGGEKVVIHYAAVMPSVEKVIYTRQDITFIEVWDEVVSETGALFWNGATQFSDDNADGFTLKPLTELGIDQGYAAFGEWDTETTSYGASLASLTFAQLAKFTARPQNNCYYDAETSELIQTRWRGRSVMGFGDKWEETEPRQHPNYGMRYGHSRTSTWVQAQGPSQTSKDYDAETINPFWSQWRSSGNAITHMPKQTDPLIFTARYMIKGKRKIYALPIALIQRMNSGATHPSYNPFGCSLKAGDADSGAITGGVPWSVVRNNCKIETQMHCFIERAYGEPANGYGGVWRDSGAIGQESGRDDYYKFYDLIHSEQVHDLRLQVRLKDYALTLEDAARMAIAGDMRGKGKVPFTKVIKATLNMGGNHNYGGLKINAPLFNHALGQGYEVSPSQRTAIIGHAVIIATGEIVKINGQDHLKDHEGKVYLYFENGGYDKLNGKEVYITISSNQHLTPEFNTLPWVDLIGSLDNLKATFPDGIIGEWIAKMPTGESLVFDLNGEAVSLPKRTYTSDNGQSWLSDRVPEALFDNIANTVAGFSNVDYVALVQYPAPSSFTKKANSSKIVGQIGDVFASSSHTKVRGSYLGCSLTGKVMKSGHTAPWVQTLKVQEYFIQENGRLHSDPTIKTTHTPVMLQNPNNDSYAFKALYTLTEKDSLLYLQFHGNSMKHNGTSWGDNGQIPIIDGEGTMTNDNGYTVKTFCHHSIFPIGIA